MNLLWNEDRTPPKTYKTYANAVKAAEKVIGDRNHRVIIAASADGRFFPVALGERAAQDGLQFYMCIAN